MKYIILLICCVSIASSQTTHFRHAQADTLTADSVWARAYGNLPGGSGSNTTIYISAIQEGILSSAVMAGSPVTFAHPFADTSYVINLRGYTGLTTVSTGIRKYADSVVFYPVDNGTSVEWMARDTSSISGTIQNGLATGTLVTFAHPFSSTDYVVLTNGFKNGYEVTVGVAKGTTTMTLTPAESGTYIMWSVGGYTQ